MIGLIIKIALPFLFVTTLSSLRQYLKHKISKTQKLLSLKGNLIISESIAKLTLGERFSLPGDYLVHEKYGIGQYIGIKYCDLTPNRHKETLVPVVVIRYKDGEIHWFKHVIEKEPELFMYRSFSTSISIDVFNEVDSDAFLENSKPSQELSSIMDHKKWKKRITIVKEQMQKEAISIVLILAMRNKLYRTPCVLSAADARKYSNFEDSFPYTPTEDQLECFQAIRQDMTRSTVPMDRLICGDVGFGKTEVAMRAMYLAVLGRKQVAVLVPTRPLALQHFRTLQARMPAVKVMILTGGNSRKAADFDRVKSAVKSGACQILVGTHALLQDEIQFERLGLLVVDEEQRFGVDHKMKMVASGVDVLTLSATPIPRTLHMSRFTEMRQLSLLRSPPRGRKEVKVHVGQWDNATVIKAITAELERGGQIFVVVPFVSSCQSMIDRLQSLMPKVRCIYAHGRCDDLENRLDDFTRRKADILVATTVIENGIDMPNVNTIIIDHADRFGMSALYQLRGRVGRSDRHAFAYFFTSRSQLTAEAEDRLGYLKIFTALGSGYELAMRDMEIRGYGTVFGGEQSGKVEIGVELEGKILNDAMEALCKKLVLPEPHVKLQLDTEVERLAASLGLSLPTVGVWEEAEGLHQMSLYEDQLADLLITYTLRSVTTVDGVQEAREKFRSASCHDALMELRTQWMSLYFSREDQLPALLMEIIDRAMLRMNAKRLGMREMERVHGNMNTATASASNVAQIVVQSLTLDEKKWSSISSSINQENMQKFSFKFLGGSSSSRGVASTLIIDVHCEELSLTTLLLSLSNQMINGLDNCYQEFTAQLKIETKLSLN